jgi:hypothetical protein
VTSGNAFLAGLAAGYVATFAMFVTLAFTYPWAQFGAWAYLQHFVLITGGLSGGIFGQCAWALARPRWPAVHPEYERLTQEESS